MSTNEQPPLFVSDEDSVYLQRLVEAEIHKTKTMIKDLESFEDTKFSVVAIYKKELIKLKELLARLSA